MSPPPTRWVLTRKVSLISNTPERSQNPRQQEQWLIEEALADVSGASITRLCRTTAWQIRGICDAKASMSRVLSKLGVAVRYATSGRGHLIMMPDDPSGGLDLLSTQL